jgi:hypothetical protein
MRTRALDGTLRPQFERWYPGLANDIAPGHPQHLRPENTRHIVMLSRLTSDAPVRSSMRRRLRSTSRPVWA